MRLVFDIETNEVDLLTSLPDVIHCIVTQDIDTGDTRVFHTHPEIPSDGDIRDGVSYLESADLIIAHNYIGFDRPVIEKLYPGFSPKNFHDTYILSQLFYPNEMARHSIAEWGLKIGKKKPKHDDWDELSEAMIYRCMEDVQILHDIFVCYMQDELSSYNWSRSVKLEYEFYRQFAKHQKYWFLDHQRCAFHIRRLTRYLDAMDKRLKKRIPPVLVKDEKVVSPFKKDGLPKANTLIYCNKSGINPESIVGDFCKVEFNDINLNSIPQVIQYLLSVGWRPEEFNFKKDSRGRLVKEDGRAVPSSPKLSGSAFLGVPGKFAELFEKRNQIKHRLGVLRGWYTKHVNGRIATFAYTNGTNTGRCRHAVVANVPRCESFYGRYMRSMFIAPEGYSLVGCDADQLEARIEGHYTSWYDNGKYAKFLMENDIHQFNADIWGISRGEAKAPGYALSYQCAPAKLSKILDCDLTTAQNYYDAYWNARPAAKQLIEDLETALESRGFKRGEDLYDTRAYVKGIDGRKLFVRSWHSLKNTVIQSAGMLAMKMAYIRLAHALQGKRARIVLIYHDEFQVLVDDSDPKLVEEVKVLAEESIQWAGEYFKLRIPLKGTANTGKNWSETH